MTETINMHFMSEKTTNLSELIKKDEDAFFQDCNDRAVFRSGEHMSSVLASYGYELDPRQCQRIRARQVKRLANRDVKAIKKVIELERQRIAVRIRKGTLKDEIREIELRLAQKRREFARL